MEQINIARLTTKQPYQRQSVGIGGADRPERSELAASIAVAYHALCVPSMGTVQKGFKSPVYRTNIEEPKEVLTMKRTTRGQLRKGDRPWEGRLWESHQPMNKNLIRGRRGGMSWHNTAKFCRSATEVNEAVGWRRTVFLPGEICPAWRPAQAGSAPSSNGRSDRAEVSRGHIT